MQPSSVRPSLDFRADPETPGDLFTTGAPLRPIVDRLHLSPAEARQASRDLRVKLLVCFLWLPFSILGAIAYYLVGKWVQSYD